MADRRGATFLYLLGYVAVWPAVVGSVLAGLPVALTMAGMMTLFHQGTADTYRGRVFGAFGAVQGRVQGLAVLAGTLAAGFFARPLGIIAVISVQGAAYLVAGVVMAVWLRGGLAVIPAQALDGGAARSGRPVDSVTANVAVHGDSAPGGNVSD